MKIAVLSRNGKLYSTRRLIEAAESRGHDVRVLDVLRCYMNITSNRPSIHYKGEDLTGFDAVIPRIGASVTFYGTAVLRQFEMMGVYPLAESVAISLVGSRVGDAGTVAYRPTWTSTAAATDDHTSPSTASALLSCRYREGSRG